MQGPPGELYDSELVGAKRRLARLKERYLKRKLARAGGRWVPRSKECRKTASASALAVGRRHSKLWLHSSAHSWSDSSRAAPEAL